MEAKSPSEALLEKFPYLEEEDIMAFFQLAKVEQVEAGELIIKVGDHNPNSILVLQGLLRTYLITSSGEERTVLFAAEGQGCAAHATILKKEPSTEYIEAIEPSIILFTNMPELEKAGMENPRLMRMYKDALADGLIDVIDRIESFTTLNREEHYVYFRDKFPGLLQRVPQKYLASYFGITTISLSRIKTRVLKGLSKRQA